MEDKYQQIKHGDLLISPGEESVIVALYPYTLKENSDGIYSFQLTRGVHLYVYSRHAMVKHITTGTLEKLNSNLSNLGIYQSSSTNPKLSERLLSLAERDFKRGYMLSRLGNHGTQAETRQTSDSIESFLESN